MVTVFLTVHQGMRRIGVCSATQRMRSSANAGLWDAALLTPEGYCLEGFYVRCLAHLRDDHRARCDASD
jgi:hypothetical protein